MTHCTQWPPPAPSDLLTCIILAACSWVLSDPGHLHPVTPCTQWPPALCDPLTCMILAACSWVPSDISWQFISSNLSSFCSRASWAATPPGIYYMWHVSWENRPLRGWEHCYTWAVVVKMFLSTSTREVFFPNGCWMSGYFDTKFIAGVVIEPILHTFDDLKIAYFLTQKRFFRVTHVNYKESNAS